jgi:hypothetical protein
MAGTAPCALMNATQRARPGTNSSRHSPRSPTVPQPRRSTLVDSIITRPQPPTAKRPAFTRCQSVAKPSFAAYWCIGATTTRFFSVTLRRVRGENSIGEVTYRLLSVRGTDHHRCPR